MKTTDFRTNLAYKGKVLSIFNTKQTFYRPSETHIYKNIERKM